MITDLVGHLVCLLGFEQSHDFPTTPQIREEEGEGEGPRLKYKVNDIPPPQVCAFLGFQHYLTMLGSTVVIPALLVPAMGGTSEGARGLGTQGIAWSQISSEASLS